MKNKGIFIFGNEKEIIIDCLHIILKNANEQTKSEKGIYIEKFYLKNKKNEDKLKMIKQIIRRIDF